ncbi:GtrA family protein [Streptomyces sp. NPDC004647]|uniref:GtrA family protein n=1 Tax=Streptomyces sp. NPDC004647 TaxID=3154671 RepID=UPI0033BBA987
MTTGRGALHQRLKLMSGEIGRFGAVGASGWLVDTAVFNLCLHVLHLQTVRSGVIATAVAIGTNYLGNRYWTYRHRDRSRRTREVTLFLLFSGIGMVIQNGVLALSHYGLEHTSALADNVAKNVIGLGVATLFRFWSYRTWVFRTLPGSEAVEAAEGILESARPVNVESGDSLGR